MSIVWDLFDYRYHLFPIYSARVYLFNWYPFCSIYSTNEHFLTDVHCVGFIHLLYIFSAGVHSVGLIKFVSISSTVIHRVR